VCDRGFGDAELVSYLLKVIHARPAESPYLPAFVGIEFGFYLNCAFRARIVAHQITPAKIKRDFTVSVWKSAHKPWDWSGSRSSV
jgi:hypothetical protein